MDARCETQIEYLTSKFLLQLFLSSSEIIEKVGIDYIEHVRKIIRENIEPYEDNFCFYHRKYVRHYNENSNSAHEGTNHGLKVGSKAAKPCHLIQNSSKKLSYQGQRTCDYFVARITQEIKEEKSWAKIPWMKHIVKRAATELIQQYNMKEKYTHIRISKTKFLLRLIESERKTKSDYVPIYLHTRILEIVDGYLKCSCGYNERFGLICRHMFYLLELLGVEPSHHDVDIRWWITFAMFAHTTDAESEHAEFLSDVFKKKLEEKKTGPKIDIYSCKNIEITDDISLSEWNADSGSLESVHVVNPLTTNTIYTAYMQYNTHSFFPLPFS